MTMTESPSSFEFDPSYMATVANTIGDMVEAKAPRAELLEDMRLAGWPDFLVETGESLEFADRQTLTCIAFLALSLYCMSHEVSDLRKVVQLLKDR